jgi:lipoprotein signal peptidase
MNPETEFRRNRTVNHQQRQRMEGLRIPVLNVVDVAIVIAVAVVVAVEVIRQVDYRGCTNFNS